MLHNRFINRTVQMGACVVVLLMCASPAMSETSRSKGKRDGQECEAARKSALEHEQSGHLVAASQLFLKCASATCGSALSEQCMTRNSRLSLTLPSVVLSVTNTHGDPLVDVQVKMDGQPLTSHLDGLSLPVDPGTHEFSFSAGEGAIDSQTITISKGERNRSISVSQKTPNKIEASGSAIAAVPLRPPASIQAPPTPPQPPAAANTPASSAVTTRPPTPALQAPPTPTQPPATVNTAASAAAPARPPAPALQAPPTPTQPPATANTPVSAAIPAVANAHLSAASPNHPAKALHAPPVRARHPARPKRGGSPSAHSRPAGAVTPGSMAAALGL